LSDLCNHMFMNSENNLPYQPDTLQQHPPRSFKPIIWKAVFIPLLVVNVVFIFWAEIVLKNGSHGTADFSALGVWVASLPLAIIDVIVLLSYRFIQRPHGIARVISFTALVLVSLPLIYALIFFILAIVLHFGRFIF
jgi:hypothetical protein